jgi:RNA-directed DNA polymerase
VQGDGCDLTRPSEHKPAAVPMAQQAGETRSRWRWVEPSVWTVRMLTTLEHGVDGGKWFRLFDKVFAERNLLAAFQRVASNDGAAGVDHVSVSQFERALPESLWEVADQLKHGTYQPQSIRRIQIPKPGSQETRPLGIPTVRDRLVQAAVVHVIEPIFERDFAEHSYGFRPGRGCKDALRRVDLLLKAGYTHVVDVDLKGYFDSIPHDRLMSRLQEKIADGPVLSLIERFLKANVLDGLEEWTPTTGTPQGAVLSPLMSNIYLDPLDHLAARSGFEMVRYADDFVILCRTAEEASRALEMVQTWVSSNGLTLHPTKTKVVDARTEGFDFLGYHFRGTRHWPRDQSVTKLKATIRAETKRTNGKSLSAIIGSLNRTLRGWFAYFQHHRGWRFGVLDGWIRGRLRSILRKRSKRRGRGRGLDHQRWPNAFFANQGLFSLAEAHVLARQSSRG